MARDHQIAVLTFLTQGERRRVLIRSSLAFIASHGQPNSKNFATNLKSRPWLRWRF